MGVHSVDSAVNTNRVKMRFGYVTLLIALCVMALLMGQSSAAPAPEPMADPAPMPFPNYVWHVLKNFLLAVLVHSRLHQRTRRQNVLLRKQIRSNTHHLSIYQLYITL